VVKTFLWQACNEILPTRANLHRKKIISDPLCPLCGRESETAGHVLWTCVVAQDVWAECLKSIHKCVASTETFVNILEVLRSRLAEEQLKLVVVIARLLWLRRNRWVFKGVLQTPAALLYLARDQLKAHSKAEAGINLKNPPTVSSEIQRWVKPPMGILKLT
jgi:hypothetical protein